MSGESFFRDLPKVVIPGISDEKPDWQVAVIDGEPEVVINAKAIAHLVKGSPLGETAAVERLRQAMQPEDFAKIMVEYHRLGSESHGGV